MTGTPLSAHVCVRIPCIFIYTLRAAHNRSGRLGEKSVAASSGILCLDCGGPAGSGRGTEIPRWRSQPLVAV